MPIPELPPTYSAKWAAICPNLTLAQILQTASDSIPHLRNYIHLQAHKLTLRTTNVHLVLNIFKYGKESVLLEFQRLSGDRAVFRYIAQTILSSLQLRDPHIELCSSHSSLDAHNSIAPQVVSIQGDPFAPPRLEGEPLFNHQDASMELIQALLSSASSPFMEVHREALVCLSALSLQSSSAQILRQITDRVTPVLCQHLKSRDPLVCSLAARIGINLFGNGVTAASLSPSDQSCLCRALIRKMKERSASVDSAIESLYDVMKQSFGLKLSPPICT